MPLPSMHALCGRLLMSDPLASLPSSYASREAALRRLMQVYRQSAAYQGRRQEGPSPDPQMLRAFVEEERSGARLGRLYAFLQKEGLWGLPLVLLSAIRGEGMDQAFFQSVAATGADDWEGLYRHPAFVGSRVRLFGEALIRTVEDLASFRADEVEPYVRTLRRLSDLPGGEDLWTEARMRQWAEMASTPLPRRDLRHLRFSLACGLVEDPTLPPAEVGRLAELIRSYPDGGMMLRSASCLRSALARARESAGYRVRFQLLASYTPYSAICLLGDEMRRPGGEGRLGWLRPEDLVPLLEYGHAGIRAEALRLVGHLLPVLEERKASPEPPRTPIL